MTVVGIMSFLLFVLLNNFIPINFKQLYILTLNKEVNIEGID